MIGKWIEQVRLNQLLPKASTTTTRPLHQVASLLLGGCPRIPHDNDILDHHGVQVRDGCLVRAVSPAGRGW